MSTSYSISVLNSIRANASEEYAARIPEATRANIESIGVTLSEYAPLRNEFANALMTKIGKTIVSTKMATNPLARFKSGGVVSPHDVEEIFIGMAKAEGAFDPEGKNPLGRRTPPKPDVAYYRQNRQDKYVVSIGDLDYTRVFTSPERLDAYISGLINSLYSADNYDEYVAMKQILGDWGKYATYGVKAFDGTDNQTAAKHFIKALRKAVLDVGYMTDKYNAAEVVTKTDASDLVLLVHKDVLVEADVEQLATAFHQSNTDMKVVPTIIPMDDFGDLTNTYGLLVDKDFFRIFDTLFHMETVRNGDGLFTNFFLHHHQILGLSPFKTAVSLAVTE